MKCLILRSRIHLGNRFRELLKSFCLKGYIFMKKILVILVAGLVRDME